MASQPANTEIQVFRRVRSQREPDRHDSIKNITHRLRSLVLIAPGEEDRTAVVSRDTAVSDMSPFMGQAAAGATRGFPIVIGPVALKDFSLVASLSGVDFPVEIGADKFVQEDATNVGGDLHQDARDLD